ncbi:hypothetical protein [Actinoallomurus sp. NPDC052274]|uniref:hypothetical protein n=1 Tax=Actinoallomurus sp. NPDC052274 TaxID=3155420 RepID=UPI003426B2A4
MLNRLGARVVPGPASRCLRCGRRRWGKRSRRNPYGPVCSARVRASAARWSDCSPAQLEKAREALEQGAVVPTRRRNVFRVISSDGTQVYLTARQACNCPAGLHSRHCYHRTAVQILTAA